MKIGTIIVGVGLNKYGHPISGAQRESAIEAIRSTAIEEFGGYTFTDGERGWFDEKTHKIISENVLIITLISPRSSEHFSKFAGFVRDRLRQQSVAVVYNGVSAVM